MKNLLWTITALVVLATEFSTVSSGQPRLEDPPVDPCAVQISVTPQGVLTATCKKNTCEDRCGIEVYETPSGAIQYTCFCTE